MAALQQPCNRGELRALNSSATVKLANNRPVREPIKRDFGLSLLVPEENRTYYIHFPSNQVCGREERNRESGGGRSRRARACRRVSRKLGDGGQPEAGRKHKKRDGKLTHTRVRVTRTDMMMEMARWIASTGTKHVGASNQQ